MPQQPTAKTDNIKQAVLILVGSLAMMSFGDAVVVWASQSLSMWQIFLLRSLFGFPIFLGLAFIFKRGMWPKHLGWASLRSLLIVATWICYYTAAPLTNLAIAAVGVYTFPLFITIITAVFLTEPVSKQQWFGVVLGFVGVIFILAPGTTEFSWLLVLPVLGGMVFSVAMVLTRVKCADEDPAVLAINLHLAFIIIGGTGIAVLGAAQLGAGTVAIYPFLFSFWEPVSWSTLTLMGFLGMLAVAYFMGVAKSYQIAPPQVMATYDYSYLIFAAFWGVIFFQEIPTGRTIVGIALIIVSGCLAVGLKRNPNSAT